MLLTNQCITIAVVVALTFIGACSTGEIPTAKPDRGVA